jgi:uncharacterized protein
VYSAVAVLQIVVCTKSVSDASDSTNSRQVKCPQCGLLALYSPTNPARPFCSERCKLIDLGEWASEGYKVPVQTQEYNELELEQLHQALNDVAGEEQQE